MDIINKILQIITDFPTLPTIYSTLSDVMANPRSTQQEVASVIMTDQAAASKVLRVANSPVFGIISRIESIYLHKGLFKISLFTSKKNGISN